MKFSEMSEEYVQRIEDELAIIQKNDFAAFNYILPTLTKESKVTRNEG